MYPFSIFDGITIVIRAQLNGNKTLKIQKKKQRKLHRKWTPRFM